MNILSDVNLDEISFGKDGKSVELRFIDMMHGKSTGTLTCSLLYSFKYQNCFEEDDSLAAYIGEVNYEKISSVEQLNGLGYNFPDNEKVAQDGALLINIEGGEVVLEIICGAAELDDTEID